MAFCPRCQKDVYFTDDGRLRRCTVCGLEFARHEGPAPEPGSGVASVVMTLARAVLYTVLIFAVVVLVGLGVLFASCALSPGQFGH
jgi:hypothetical protein